MKLWEWLKNLVDPEPGKVIPLYPHDDSYAANWMEIANKEIGVHELLGGRNNLRILQYHEATTLGAKDQRVSWCASFVSWCLVQAKIENPRSAWALDYLKLKTKLNKPIYGCIVVLRRGPSNGHVGFFVGYSGNGIRILGGNQKDSVCIESFNEESVIGYFWPDVRQAAV